MRRSLAKARAFLREPGCNLDYPDCCGSQHGMARRHGWLPCRHSVVEIHSYPSLGGYALLATHLLAGAPGFRLWHLVGPKFDRRLVSSGDLAGPRGRDDVGFLAPVAMDFPW